MSYLDIKSRMVESSHRRFLSHTLISNPVWLSLPIGDAVSWIRTADPLERSLGRPPSPQNVPIERDRGVEPSKIFYKKVG